MRVLIGLLIAMFGAVSQSSTPGEADEILTQLAKIRLDKKQIYNIRDITLRRDVLSIALNRGVLAFLEPVNGKITGAVFVGDGEIVAIPPDPVEKQQVYKFTGTPILNEVFLTAVLRFTDGTAEEIKTAISQHAQEDVAPEDAARLDSLDVPLGERAALLNVRLLSDFLDTPPKPIFRADLRSDKRGWFNVVFDARVPEEVSIFQVREIAGNSIADIWASFDQRSEARNREAVAHENKSPLDIVSYDIEGMPGPDKKIEAKVTLKSKALVDGARVVHFALSPAMKVSSVSTDNAEAVPFYQYPGAGSFTTVLPRALKKGQELTLKFAYAGILDPRDIWYPIQGPQNIPEIKATFPLPADEGAAMVKYLDRTVVAASYHDHWLFEGLNRYVAAMAADKDANGAVMRTVLLAARNDLRSVENAGAIWLGQRLTSSISTGGYRAVLGKGFWVIHMLRTMLQDDKFVALLGDFVETYNGKTASTWDFEHIAEKHAGKKLDWFFDEWVFDTGLPTYTVDYKVEPSGSEFTVEGMIKQSGVPDAFAMPVPVYADGEYLGTVQVSDSEGEFRFRVPKRPDKIELDPKGTILTP